MEEPRIQFAKTEDGVSIAYWALGEGTPFIYTPPSLNSHIQLEWQWPSWRKWYERVGRGQMLVRYDGRGSGLSDRDMTEVTLQTMGLDLEAVVESIGLDTINLFGNYASAGPAIAYAARHPDRVLHLILWSPVLRFSDVPLGFVKIAELAEVDWELYTETAAAAVHGWPEDGDAKRYAAFTREASSAKAFMMMWEHVQELLTLPESDLKRVSCPTLVLQRRQTSIPTIESARYVASNIPNAQLVIAEGASREPFLGDWEQLAGAIDEFLSHDEGPEAQRSLPSGMTAILFLDIADSTALTTKLGDAAYREKERELDASLRAAIAEAGGTPVEGKVLGDGIMSVFTSARQAIDAAQRCRDAGSHAGLPLHLGIHAGDVVREGNNVHGGAVQMAARVVDVAEPGEILVSATVRDLARTSAGVEFEDRGEHEMKGIAEPQRLFAVLRPAQDGEQA